MKYGQMPEVLEGGCKQANGECISVAESMRVITLIPRPWRIDLFYAKDKDQESFRRSKSLGMQVAFGKMYPNLNNRNAYYKAQLPN